MSSDQEKMLISTVLSNGKDLRLVYRLLAIVAAPHFEVKQNGEIWTAIDKVILNQEQISLTSVASALGPELEAVGGLDYLNSLAGYNQNFAGDLDPYLIAKDIKNTGQIRLVGRVLGLWGNKVSDITAIAQKYGPEEIVNRVMDDFHAILSTKDTGYKPASAFVDAELERMEKRMRGELVEYLDIGMPSLIKFRFPRPSVLVGVAGLPSMGKTLSVAVVCLGMARQLHESGEKGVVTINSLETEGEELVLRLACAIARVDSDELKLGHVTVEQRARYEKAIRYIGTLPLLIDDDFGKTSDQYFWEAQTIHLVHGRRYMGMSDYLELFTDRSENEERRLFHIINQHRSVMRLTGSCEFLLAQYSKTVEARDSKQGDPNDTKFTSFLYQGGDVYIDVWNPKQLTISGKFFRPPKHARLDVAYWRFLKNKQSKPGEVAFRYEPEFGIMTDETLPEHELFKGFYLYGEEAPVEVMEFI